VGQEAASKSERSLRFVPSRVEGLPDVAEVVFRPDRLELLSAGRWVLVRFAEIARRPRPARLWRLLARFEVGVHHDQAEGEGVALAQDMMARLGIAEGQLVDVAYIDLMGGGT